MSKFDYGSADELQSEAAKEAIETAVSLLDMAVESLDDAELANEDPTFLRDMSRTLAALAKCCERKARGLSMAGEFQ